MNLIALAAKEKLEDIDFPRLARCRAALEVMECFFFLYFILYL